MASPTPVKSRTLSKSGRFSGESGASRPWKASPRKAKGEPKSAALTVLWIDPCELLSDLLALHLEKASASRLRMAGRSLVGSDSVALARTIKPALIVLDSGVSDTALVTLLEDLAEVSPGSRLLVLIRNGHGELASELIRSGIHGLIAKNKPLAHILSVMEIVASQGCYFDDSIQHLLRTGNDKRNTSLTLREKSVLRLVASGLSTKEIGSQLEISAKTADKFRQRIMRKLDLHDAVQMTRYAISHGFAAL